MSSYAKRYDVIFLATERPDYSGNIFFKYRGVIVIYIPGEGYCIEDNSAEWPEIVTYYKTLDLICATINATKALARAREHVTQIMSRQK